MTPWLVSTAVDISVAVDKISCEDDTNLIDASPPLDPVKANPGKSELTFDPDSMSKLYSAIPKSLEAPEPEMVILFEEISENVTFLPSSTGGPKAECLSYIIRSLFLK